MNATSNGRSFAVTSGVGRSVRAWLDGDRPAVAPRDASTVLIVRDAPGGAGGVEVFMQMRAATMAFAPSVYVFPGGGVDRRDDDPALPWAGPSPSQWAGRLGASDEGQARRLVVAAVREVFEECGVLLAGPDARSVVSDVTGPEWSAARAQLAGRERSFAQILAERGLAVRTDLLRLCDHWVGPEFEAHRYDTRFFTALLPRGQVPDDDCRETEHVRWVRPQELLDELGAGRVRLFPPTIVRLEALTAARDAASFVGQDHRVPTWRPELALTPDGVGVVVPGLPPSTAGVGERLVGEGEAAREETRPDLRRDRR